MATNPYISKKVRSEQSLYEDLVIESLKFYGEDVYYIPREIVNKDKIFADDVPSRFSDAYKIETYIENTEGFDGEGDLFTKFGIELRDQATFVFARRRWKKLIGDNLAEVGFRPREGDIIYLPMSNSMFEVMKVETETPFYQLSQLPTFRLQCELFEYSDEDFDTNIASIDAIEYEGAYQYKVTMKPSSENNLVFDLGGRENINTFSGSLKTVGDIVQGGQGYQSAPTITLSAPTTTPTLFGQNALSSDVNRAFNSTFLFTNGNGTVELFFYPNAMPTESNPLQSLLLVGGNGTLDPNIMVWGVNYEGHIAYNFVDETDPTLLANTPYTIGAWNHLLVGVDSNGSGVNSKLYSYLNGRKILDSDVGRDIDLIGNNTFGLGTDALRTVGSNTFEVFDGKIDEFRALSGHKSEIFDGREIPNQTFTPSIVSGYGGNYFFDSAATDRDGLIVEADSGDPTITILLGDTITLTNNITTDADQTVTYTIQDFFGGAIVNGSVYYVPTDAQDFAGFAATEEPTVSLQQGGTLSFDAFIDDLSDPSETADVRFRLEYQTYPDVDPSYDTSTVTVSGTESTNYTISIPTLGNNTYSSIIMYVDTTDVYVDIRNIQLEFNASGQHPLRIEDADNNILVDVPDDSNGAGGFETTFTPTAAGSYFYQCSVHPAMRGEIFVDNKTLTVPTSQFDSDVNTAFLEHFEGTTAQITANLTNESVTSLTLVDGGSLYTEVPTISISSHLDSSDFLVGEDVTQTNANYTIKGEVTRWSDSDRILQLAHVGTTDGTFNTFALDKPVVGASSGAQWLPSLVEDLQQIQPTAQNKVFDDFEADFLDFSESNPFGDMF